MAGSVDSRPATQRGVAGSSAPRPALTQAMHLPDFISRHREHGSHSPPRWCGWHRVKRKSHWHSQAVTERLIRRSWTMHLLEADADPQPVNAIQINAACPLPHPQEHAHPPSQNASARTNGHLRTLAAKQRNNSINQGQRSAHPAGPIPRVPPRTGQASFPPRTTDAR